MPGWRLYELVSDQAKNKMFSSDVFSWDAQNVQIIYEKDWEGK